MKKFLSLLMIPVFMLGLVLTGCGKDDKTEAVQEYSTVYSGEYTTLNYLVTASTEEFAAAANLVDCLVEYDKYGVVQPCLAESWSVSEDGLTWTFNLRKGVKWLKADKSEYAEVVAQDFVDGMKYVLNSDNNSETAQIAYTVLKNGEKYYNKEITDFEQVGIKAKDQYTIEYTLEKPTPYFLSMVTYVCFMPVNGKFLEECGDKFGTDNQNLLYNGAYVLETYEPQSKRVFVKNDQYWDKDKVYITKLTHSYNKEAGTLSPELYLRGEITGTSIPSSSLDEWMKDATKKEQMRPSQTSFYTYFYAFNFNPKFAAEYEPDNWKIAVNNANFRKSIFHALDRKAAMMTTEPYDPERMLSNTITPKDFVNLNGTDYTKLGELKTVSERDSFDNKTALDYKAKAMAELNGKAKFPVKVLMPYNTSGTEWANRAQVVEQQLEKLLGKDYIDIILLPHQPTGFLKETRRAGNYGIMECNWGPDYADPETYTDPFVPSGNYNWPQLATNYKEANGKNTYENMVDKAKSEVLDIEKRYTAFADAEALLINEAFVIPYAVGGGGYMASKLDPFTSQYAPFGVSENKYKGMKIMDKPMNTETYNQNRAEWEKQREEALKAAAK